MRTLRSIAKGTVSACLLCFSVVAIAIGALGILCLDAAFELDQDDEPQGPQEPPPR